MSKILIVFGFNHLAYSPTTLNLFYSLRKNGHDVTILTEAPVESYSKQRINDPKILYVKAEVSKPSRLSRLRGWILRRFSNKKKAEHGQLLSAKAMSFLRVLRSCKADKVVAVDFFALWCVQQVYDDAFFLSLEIIDNDKYQKACDAGRIGCVFIQSEDRFKYLFKEGSRPPFLILPNSPYYFDFDPVYSAREKGDLIFCGSALPEFGIFSCLDFLLDYREYKLTVKGAIPEATRASIEKFYGELLETGRLILNDTYMDADELNVYVSKFWAGFAFYDFYRFPFLRSFNYYTAPSGKLYQYFNSGVPVVGNLLDGFRTVVVNNSGRLISALGSRQIKDALDEISRDYEDISANSKRSSLEFDLTRFMKLVVETIEK